MRTQENISGLSTASEWSSLVRQDDNIVGWAHTSTRLELTHNSVRRPKHSQQSVVGADRSLGNKFQSLTLTEKTQ